MKKLLKFKNSLIMMLGVLLCLSGLISCSITIDLSTDNNGQVIENSNDTNSSTQNTTADSSNITIDNIPAYSGDDYIILNNNIPNFSESDLTTTSFEEYAPLDDLGRCGVAYSNIGTDIMPTEKRGNISSVKPTGWINKKYDTSLVDGEYIYNRCHLIGHQLAGEDANEKNLITGTRYFNVEGMLPFENIVADYVKETNNHVLYRVTPVYDGDDLVAKGVQIEAYSVEDDGEGVLFNVFVYNVQPGITIDYATGNSEQDAINAGYRKVKR